MDTLNTLLLGWLVFGVFMVLLSKFLYDKFLAGDQTFEDENDVPYEEDNAGPTKGPAPTPSVVRKKAKIVPEELPKHVSAPVATGGDPDAVRWINNLLVWFFEGTEGGPIVKEAWNDSLNEFTVGTALETGVLIEIIEFLPQSSAPTLSNIIVDCSPTDDITVTCDMTVTLYMRVQTTRTQRDVTTESEYACAVRPLRGRLNIAMRIHECVAFTKFDGWPEVNMELEGVRNNAEGLDEMQLQEVVKEELTAALRKVTLELNFIIRKNFPRFLRARTLPDHVMPVGYDALVRERQTHPPSFEPKIPTSRTPVPLRSKKNQTVKVVEESFPIIPPPVVSTEVLVPVEVPSSKELILPHGDFLPTPDESAAKLLTVSEESLVRRNLERYVEDFSKDSKNKIEDKPKDVPSLSKPEAPPAKVPAEDHVALHPPLGRASMVFSSREKPIDEPNSGLCFEREEDVEEEEEPVLLKKLKSPPSLTGPPPPPRSPQRTPHSRSPQPSPQRSPTRDFDHLKESFKETLKNIPFSKHLPSGVTGGRSQPSPTAPVSGHPAGIVGLNGKRLLVKVVKATGVGGDAGVSACYVVCEMDDPSQKFTTNVITDTSSPFWDEQFLFDLSDNTLELLFELYDKSDGRFVGLGIVGIEELVATPSQRQIIPLQGRPYEKDEVSGSLTCEFLFLDRADLPDLTLRKTTTGQFIAGKLKPTPATTMKPPEETNTEEEGSGCATETAEAAPETLTEDEQGALQSTHATLGNRTTLVIHAPRKVARTPSGEYTELANESQVQTSLEDENFPEDGEDADYKPGVSTQFGSGVSSSGTYPGSSPSQRPSQLPLGTPVPPSSLPGSGNNFPKFESSGTQVPGMTSFDSNGLNFEERGRARSRRKRDFFGSLRRRFSRSKIRSKSVEPTGAGVDAGHVGSLGSEPLGARSISMERSTSNTRSRGKSTVSSPTSPGSQTQNASHYLHLLHGRCFLTVPLSKGRSTPSGGFGSADSGSTRSSLSGTSGLSSASTKTYINEASLLVVETLENGVVKHYLVPLCLQRKNKWRKKGTKLHVYNEHTFVAKHLSSSVTCQVCEKGLGRRLGKQGYECRDCSFKCHKPCHVKTDLVCPNSTVNSMDLVYVKDEKAERRRRVVTS